MLVKNASSCSSNYKPAFGQVKGYNLSKEYKALLKSHKQVLDERSEGLIIKITQLKNKPGAPLMAVAEKKYSFLEKMCGNTPSAIGIASIDTKDSLLSVKKQIFHVFVEAKQRLNDRLVTLGLK